MRIENPQSAVRNPKWALLLVLLVGCSQPVGKDGTQAQKPTWPEPRPEKATTPPDRVPAVVTYLDQAGQKQSVEGELIFDAWPIILDGQPASIDRWELFSYDAGSNHERSQAWMRREGDQFVISSLRGLWRVQFGFDVLTPAGEPADGQAPPVTFAAKDSPARAIPVSAIQSIEMTTVKWNPWTVKR